MGLDAEPTVGRLKEDDEKHVIVEMGVGANSLLINATNEYRKYLREDPHIHYFALDIEHEGLIRAGKTTQESIDQSKGFSPSDRITYLRASATKLPFADGSVSETVFRNVFGDTSIGLLEREDMLRESRRVLKDGGVLKIVEEYTPGVVERDEIIRTARLMGFETLDGNEIPDRERAFDESVRDKWRGGPAWPMPVLVWRLKKRDSLTES